MSFLESRLLSVRVSESGREVVMEIIDTAGTRFVLELYGVERLLVDELRQQNVIEEVRHWTHGKPADGLREAAFVLMTGVAEKDCEEPLAVVACSVVDRIARGELEMLEITAIFGAQILASFASMTVRPVT